MSHVKLNQNKSKKTDMVEQKKQDVKVSVFIQMLAINRDTNMIRIYSAIQSNRKND
jgi:hypothetical protein